MVKQKEPEITTPIVKENEEMKQVFEIASRENNNVPQEKFQGNVPAVRAVL